MIGGHGAGGRNLPRVMQISITRHGRGRSQRGRPQTFAVAIHEEGTAITWRQDVVVDPEDEAYFASAVRDLYFWSRNLALTLEQSARTAQEVGHRLHRTFIGPRGEEYLERCLGDRAPTAVLLDVDETILDLPWELLRDARGALIERVPLGRLVTTHVAPRPGRDPVSEDTTVKILAVANPSANLPASEAEIAALTALEGQRDKYTVRVTLLEGDKATRSEFRRLLLAGDYDVVHFAGHASFDPTHPGTSALLFADGPLTADDLLQLEWTRPPYLVFNSACQSGRAAGRRRLVSARNRGNGLAAAFLATGGLAYVGYFWPVSDAGAGVFARTFYGKLFELENVGEAFLAARREAIRELGDIGDLTGYSAILYGDAATKERRDVFTAA